MIARTRARSEQELIYLINQALDDIFDLRAAIEYDEESMDNLPAIIDPLNDGLSRMLNAIKSGEYQPGAGNHIDFLHILKHTDQRAIPTWPTLKLILDTHTEGYLE
jgi:hypothetical protein